MPPSRPIAERFYEKVDRTGECWNWTGSVDLHGYGRLSISNRPVPAHRVAWFLHCGTWPDGLLMHSCDNPRCVRIEHLSAGSHKDNMADMVAKRRHYAHKHGGIPWAKAPPPRYGTDHHAAKLTGCVIEQMRMRRSDGLTYSEIAAEFGVSRSTAERAIKGTTYSKAA